MSVDYQECYEQLEIKAPTSWTDLNNHYRKLVQIWHPDRYAGSQPDVAERKFIEMTKAFGTLRDYYRAHDKLPLIAITPDTYTEHSVQSGGIDNRQIFGNRTDKPSQQSLFKPTPFARRAIIQGGGFFLVAVTLLVLFWSMENRNRARLVNEAHIVNSSTEGKSFAREKTFKPYPAVLPGTPGQSNDL